MNPRHCCAFLASLIEAVCADNVALAQPFPSKPLRIVVPFPPSGSVDVSARALQVPLAKALGQSVVVDPEFELTGKLGVFGRSAIPKDAINRLGAEIVRALNLPEVRESLFRQGIAAAPLGPAEFDALIRAEIPKIQKIVRAAGIRLD